MADVLSRVQILLDADTARFEQKMNAAPATATRNFDKIKSSAKVMATVVASAVLASAGAMITYADNQVKSINELERFAYLAQSTVPEFQKMAVGAEMFGVQQDKLADITKDFNEKLGEMATVSGGGALDFIEQVGVKTEGSAEGAMKLLKTMGDLSGPEGMALYVEKMEDANLSQKQMSFLMESVASDSTMLLPLLKNNAQGMKLWGDAAEDAGIILSSQTVKSAREMQVQSKMLDMQLQGVKNQLTAAVMPALVDVAGAFKTGGKEATGMANAGEVLANVLRGVASVAIGVYATVNMVANSMAGVTKSAVDSYKLADMASQKGSWFDKLPGMKLLKSGITFAVTAQAPDSGIGMAMEDNAKIWQSTADSINNMWDSKVSENIKLLAELQEQSAKTSAAATQGTQDWLDKQNQVIEASNKAIQAQKELERIQERQYQERESIKREYADRLKQIDVDLNAEMKRIQEASFSPQHQNAYIEAAKARAYLERSLFISEQEFEINQHRYTEEQKLAKEYEINQLKVQSNYDLNEQMLNAALDSLSERYGRELEWMRLEKAQAENDAGEILRADLQNLEIKYDFERKQILLNSKLSEDEQQRRIALSRASEDFEKRRNLNDAYKNWGSTQADISGNRDQYRIDQERFSRYDESQALFDGQMALANSAAEREAIWQAHSDRMMAIEQSYKVQSTQLTLGYGEQISDSYSEMFKNVLGEQSAAYKTMFVAQKMFSISSSVLAIKTGIANAASLPFPSNLAAMTQVAAATASLITDIKSIEGVFHGGQDYVPKEASYLLDRGERVLSRKQNTDLTQYLAKNADSKSGANISITNNTPSKVSAQQTAGGRVFVTIDEVEQFVSQSLAQPNSRISKSIGQNTNAGRRR